MLRLRPYKHEDAATILSWSKDERAYYKWCAGVIGEYPATEKELEFFDSLMAFTAFDEDGTAGFFTFRNPGGDLDVLRIGFVVVDPARRGKGQGKEMIRLALKYAFEVYGAKKVTLGVFENNEAAYYCYKAAGFKDIVLDETETYTVMDEVWVCKEMEAENDT